MKKNSATRSGSVGCSSADSYLFEANIRALYDEKTLQQLLQRRCTKKLLPSAVTAHISASFDVFSPDFGPRMQRSRSLTAESGFGFRFYSCGDLGVDGNEYLTVTPFHSRLSI